MNETATATSEAVDERLVCEDCEARIEDGQQNDGAGNTVCENCYNDHYFSCDDCGDSVHIDNCYSQDENSYCSSCYDQLDHHTGIPEREYFTGTASGFMSVDRGEIITSPRVFSAELEAYYPSDRAMQKAGTELDDYVGISGDGSLNRRGVEFQTPKLQGAKGEKAIREICDTLNALDFTTDRTTGLHLHLDGAGLTGKANAIKRLWSFYLAYESVLLSFLPPSRRGNRYCNLLSNDFHSREVEKCRTITGLEALWYRTRNRATIDSRKSEKYDQSRYSGVNLHSLLANGHLEIRYHSGTLNATKILEWTNLHQTIMDKASAWNNLDMRVASIVDLKERTERMYNALELPARARMYFTERQNTFTSTAKDKDESETASALFQAVNEPELCVG